MLPPFLTFAHQLHGNFLMTREAGRPIVGWLGVAMCILGVTGLVLWWPRRGQWKYAFKVRAEATGLRFHRELHAATGIWFFIVFMAVSFSGVVIAWPQTSGMNPPGFNPRQMPTVEVRDTKRLGATEAVIAAQTAVPSLVPRVISFPARPDQPISVNYLANGAVNASVLVDPYSGKVLAVRDGSERFQTWMRPVHQGSLNGVWRILVFLSGLVPLLFVVTGITMWAKKRQRHIPMTAMTEDVALRRRDRMTVPFPLDAFDHAHAVRPKPRPGFDRAKLISIGITIAIHVVIVIGALTAVHVARPRVMQELSVSITPEKIEPAKEIAAPLPKLVEPSDRDRAAAGSDRSHRRRRRRSRWRSAPSGAGGAGATRRRTGRHQRRPRQLPGAPARPAQPLQAISACRASGPC